MRIIDDVLWQEITPWMVNLRRKIHRYPEMGLETIKTAELVELTLKELGYITWRPITNGVAATLGPQSGGATLLRADMDGLPILENTDLPFASEVPGTMHACGHDSHTAMLLGAAYYLKAHEKDLSHPVTLMFQPAEEGPGGALPMIEGGVLERPRVARAVMVHVSGDLPVGMIGLRGGQAMASPNEFSVTIHGKGGHGAHPDVGVDAIVVAASVVQAVQTLVSREQNPTEPLVVTFGTIQGGYRHNVLADKVEMTGTIRVLSEATRERIIPRFTDMIQGIAASYRAQADVHIEPGYPPLEADTAWTHQVHDILAQELGVAVPFDIPHPSMGAEDFAYIAQRVPATSMGIGVRGAGYRRGLHSAEFILDEAAMPYAAVALAGEE